jgi:hypothetical protein
MAAHNLAPLSTSAGDSVTVHMQGVSYELMPSLNPSAQAGAAK